MLPCGLDNRSTWSVVGPLSVLISVATASSVAVGDVVGCGSAADADTTSLASIVVVVAADGIVVVVIGDGIVVVVVVGGDVVVVVVGGGSVVVGCWWW